MTDPYKALGMSPSATDEEIKLAYRELVKKYHPDNYSGSPLADLAGEKMSEINAAYDEVQRQRKNGGAQPSSYGYSNGQGQGYNQGYGSYNGGGQFDDIRRLITMGRILEAEELLDGISAEGRSAEWNYLKGNVLYTRGFLEDAFNYFQIAAQMDPQNPEYRNALDTLMRQRQYGYGQVNTGYSSCSPCSICSALMCANCTCNTCRCCF